MEIDFEAVELEVGRRLVGFGYIYILDNPSFKGMVKVGNLKPTEVVAGDIVVIPAGVTQKITNIGETDLVFHCICAPRFTSDSYCGEEEKKDS